MRKALALAFALVATAAQAARIDFVEPAENAALIGDVRFAFEVDGQDPPIDRIDVYSVDRGVLLGAATAPDWSFTVQVPTRHSSGSVLAVAFANGVAIDRVRRRTKMVVLQESVRVAMVVLYPVVEDERGDFVAGLGQDSFRVFDHGRATKIATFSNEPQDLTLTLLLDVSSSMREELAVVQRSTIRFLDRLSKRDRVSVFAFNTDLVALGRPDDPRRRVDQAIYDLTPRGGTALYDAMLQVIDSMREVRGRKALFVFSDGEDQNSLASLRMVISEARDADVLLYAVGALNPDVPTKERLDLAAMAAETGGRDLTIGNARELSRAYDEVLSELRAQYVVGFFPRRGVPGIRSVRVEVNDPALTVRSRRTYTYRGE